MEIGYCQEYKSLYDGQYSVAFIDNLIQTYIGPKLV